MIFVTVNVLRFYLAINHEVGIDRGVPSAFKIRGGETRCTVFSVSKSSEGFLIHDVLDFIPKTSINIDVVVLMWITVLILNS